MGRTIDDAGHGLAGRSLGARRAGMRTHNGMLSYVCAVCRLVCYRPSKRGMEDGVRDDGGWTGDTWCRRVAPSKAGGPRSVRVCRSLKGCGALRSAAQWTLDRQGREGRGAQRDGDLHRKQKCEILLSKSAVSGRAGASVRAE
ncbi:hypothetical protein EVAR_42437_1 [Eumeta japonica]|uniref:Uncharacterized protein n=1 Tax=Eumeta variegata TaxID=151549 RepID=A0A4C1X6X1_EUMVA|nr:hypothetical protein EVAR_42437_1 [Eumeta japonica]